MSANPAEKSHVIVPRILLREPISTDGWNPSSCTFLCQSEGLVYQQRQVSTRRNVIPASSNCGGLPEFNQTEGLTRWLGMLTGSVHIWTGA